MYKTAVYTRVNGDICRKWHI